MNHWIYVGLSDKDKYAAARYFKSKDVESAEKVALSVAESFGVTVSEIKGKSRYRTIADARHSMVQITRQELGYSMNQIGICINRHHSTIINSLRVFEQIYQSDNLFAQRHDKAYSLYKKTLKDVHEKTL